MQPTNCSLLGIRAVSPFRQRRAHAVLDSGLPIIEDDAYADLRFGGPAPAPLLAEAPRRVLSNATKT